MVHKFRPGTSLCSFLFVWLISVRPRGRWLLWDLSGSSECAMGVADFVLARMGRLGAPLVSFGFVWFVRVCNGDR